MDQRKLECVCKQQFTEEEFARHYISCMLFKQQFKEFDSKFGELLKAYSEPKERLLIVKFLLKQYINVIDKKLKKHFATLVKNQEGGAAPPLGGRAPSGMSNNIMGMNQNQYSQNNNNNQFFSDSNINNSNNSNFNALNNNPYKQNSQNSNSNPYQNHNENPYLNKNNQNNQNNQNPYQNLNNQNNQNENPYKQNHQNKNNQNPYKQSSNPFAHEGNDGINNDFVNDFHSQPQQEENNSTLCQKCKVNPDVVYLSCVHPICSNCFSKYAEENFYDMKCSICQKIIDDQVKKMILGEKKMTELENKALMMLVGNLTKCPNCGEQNVFEEGSVDYNVRDEQNQRLSKQAAEDYAKHRCRCGICKKDFCINPDCQAIPYHLGKTCEEFKHYEKAKKCRFCEQEIKGNRGPDDDVCNDNDCKERFKFACKKKLQCGHKCFGVNGERNCPPCIDKECPQFKGQYGQNKDEYCIICYSEGLGSSPIVVTSCGHYMHYQCIKKRLETKWIGPKITFNHCLCPSCNKWFDIESL